MEESSFDKIILTIGSGNRTLVDFIALLQKFDVEVLCDVRSSPFSGRFPHFNGPVLRESLRSVGIRYIFLGAELGARPKDEALYEGGRVSYEKLAQSSPFREAVERVRQGSKTRQCALMCAEREPLDCHRAILIARHLVALKSDVAHITRSGSIEGHEDLEQRLLDLYKARRIDIFGDQGNGLDVLVEAYSRRGKELAYDIDQAYKKAAGSA